MAGSTHTGLSERAFVAMDKRPPTQLIWVAGAFWCGYFCRLLPDGGFDPLWLLHRGGAIPRGGYLLLAVSFTLLAVGVMVLKTQLRRDLRGRGIETSGTVFEPGEYVSRNEYRCKLRYQVEGKDYTAEVRITKPMPVGTLYTVVYDPRKPSRYWVGLFSQ